MALLSPEKQDFLMDLEFCKFRLIPDEPGFPHEDAPTW